MIGISTAKLPGKMACRFAFAFSWPAVEVRSAELSNRSLLKITFISKKTKQSQNAY